MTAPRWDERDVQAGDVRLHVRRLTHGQGAAAPVLLLHGFGVSGAVWQAFARRLLPDFAAVAPDLRGHGESGAPPDGYAPADYSRDLVLLVRELGIAPCPIVGHSLGALVALALADAHPSVATALVLVDPPIDAQRPNPDVEHVYRLRTRHDGALERYLREQNPAGGELLASSLARLFRRADAAAYEAIMAAPPGWPDAWQQAARVRQPTLLVQADPRAGGLIGDETAAAFTTRLANGALRTMAGATHAVHASQPAALAAVITRFLRRG